MSLKNLRSFLTFNSSAFFADKKLYYLNCKELQENNGVKITLLILEDLTEYKTSNNNLGEQITVKVLNKSSSDFINFQPMQTICEVVDISKANVYGEYQNQLSITGSVVKINQGGKN